MQHILLLILKWLLLFLLGLLIVILTGLYIRGAFQSSVKYRVKQGPTTQDSDLAIVLSGLSTSFFSQGRVTQFWSTPEQIQKARLEAIQRAKNTIHFETFYMTPGQRANDFAAAVSRKAAIGVEVLLLVDSYGAASMPKCYWNRLRRAGVQIVMFNSFSWRAPINFAGRTHRKLLLIDGNVGLIGGAGISDEWDGDTNSLPWLDIEIQVEGNLLPFLEGQFIQHWTYGGGEAKLDDRTFEVSNQQVQDTLLVTSGNSPTYRYSPIKSLKVNLIVAAQRRIWIASPYMLPDQDLRRLMVEAKQAGVEVRLLTACAQEIDKPYVYYAAFELYGELLEAGVEIYEYQPSMVHAKMLLVDWQWVNVGSANFDSRSFFHNDELDLTTCDSYLIEKTEEVFKQAFALSHKVSLQDWQKRSWWRHKLLGRLTGFIQWQL